MTPLSATQSALKRIICKLRWRDENHIVLHHNSDEWAGCRVTSLCLSCVPSLPSSFSPLQISSLLLSSTVDLLCSLTFYLLLLMLFRVLLQSWTETQRVVCVCVCVSSKTLLQCDNNRCNGHHDTTNLSSVYCVCWTITDRVDRWTDGWSSCRPSVWQIGLSYLLIS